MKTEKFSLRSYLTLKHVNFVIRILTISDILIIGGFGLIVPIFAVFITENIVGGTVEIAGIASAIFLLTRSIGQIPAAILIDKIRGEKDDFWAMLIGSVICSLVPLAYIVISSPLQLFATQFIYGLAAAFTFPSWLAVFTRHIDKNHEGVEWGVYQTLIDLGSAGAASVGGFLAYRYGFYPLFIIVSLTTFVGSMFLVFVYKNMKSGKVILDD